MRQMKKSWSIPVIVCMAAGGPLYLGGCISFHAFRPVPEPVGIEVLDSATRAPLQDFHAFEFHAVTGKGHFGLAETTVADAYYGSLGEKSCSLNVPAQTYRTYGYNVLLASRKPTDCQYSLVIFKRGYQTFVWSAGLSTTVLMKRLEEAYDNDPRATGEGEIDWLFYWSALTIPGELGRFFSTTNTVTEVRQLYGFLTEKEHSSRSQSLRQRSTEISQPRLPQIRSRVREWNERFHS